MVADQHAESVACDHPLDAIHWNPHNEVTQCHRCGHVMDRTPMPSGDAEHWSPDDAFNAYLDSEESAEDLGAFRAAHSDGKDA